MRRAGWWCAAPLVLAAGGCGEEAGPELADESFWETPDLPGPVAVEVAGRAVDPVLVHGFLLPLWTEYWSACSAAGQAAAAAGFYADPQALFTPLVRGIVLLQEAERRWPELPAGELQQFHEEMAASTGEVLAALERRIGAAGVRAHVERELRKRLLLEEFGAEAPEVTEDEIFSRYEAMMAEVDDPAQLLEMGIDFAALAPQIRADLERARAVEEQEAWIDAQMPSTRVQVSLPGRDPARW